MPIDTQHLVERNQRLWHVSDLIAQPARPEVANWPQSFYWGVIRGIPDDDAPYVDVQFVKPAADYAETGLAEFIPGSMRPVLTEINLTAGDYKEWLWEGPETEWVDEIMVHIVFPAYGALWIQHKGQFEIIHDTGDDPPTDCYRFGDH